MSVNGLGCLYPSGASLQAKWLCKCLKFNLVVNVYVSITRSYKEIKHYLTSEGYVYSDVIGLFSFFT